MRSMWPNEYLTQKRTSVPGVLVMYITKPLAT